jgi:hypothetical protein
MFVDDLLIEIFVTRASLRSRVPKRNKSFSLFGNNSSSSSSHSSTAPSSTGSVAKEPSSGFASLGLSFKKKTTFGSLTGAFQPPPSSGSGSAPATSPSASSTYTASSISSSSSIQSVKDQDWTPENVSMSYRTYRAFIEQSARALPSRALTPSPPPSAPPPPQTPPPPPPPPTPTSGPPPVTPKPTLRSSGPTGQAPPPPPPPLPPGSGPIVPPKPRATISEMKNSAASGPVQFDELVDVLEKANGLINKLEEGFQQWCNSQQTIVDTVDGVNTTIGQFDENKKQFVAKMKKVNMIILRSHILLINVHFEFIVVASNSI